MRRTLMLAAAVILLASAACRSAVDLSTSAGQVRFGVQAAKMDLWREAQFRFLRAVQMSPDDMMAYNNLAVAYEGIGEYEKARETYLRALQIDRSNQYVQRNYSRFVEFYSRREKDAEADERPEETQEDSATPAAEPPGGEPERVDEAEPDDAESTPDDEAEPDDAEPAPDDEAEPDDQEKDR
ncbi:MAG: tetratricopeptide repeat protein [Acidobacteria bacterium]|nr:tetratricopeptide repeat protein [Acidobacteriota bacterium]